MSKLLVTIALLTLLLSSAFGQSIKGQKTIKQIKNYLTQLEDVGFSGSLLVELDGEKVISKGYGFRNKEQQLKNSPSTIFDIGSITKQFTAAAILKLEMQKQLTVEDKITLYFENVPVDKQNITIHDLLRHQSGLQSTVGGDFEKISQSDFINKVMNSKLRFEPGVSFSYSNIGYSLLALIIEKVSGSTYENYLYENLWKPSNMELTGYSRPQFDSNAIAVGYYRDDKVWGKPTDKEWDNSSPFWHLKGNGGILSTTEDLYKWHKVLMTEQILSKEAKEKLYHPKLRQNENPNPHYGYGWDVFVTDRKTLLVQHNGANNILYADFNRYIDDRVTLIMLSNKSQPTFDRLNQEIAKIIFQNDYKPIIPVANNQANRDFTEKTINTLLNKGLETAKHEYIKRDKKVDLIEEILNNKGYSLISEKQINQAIAIFEMNTFAFPKSANAFDSLGEAYMTAGNKDLAIKNYEKSIVLNPENMNAKEMIIELRK